MPTELRDFSTGASPSLTRVDHIVTISPKFLTIILASIQGGPEKRRTYCLVDVPQGELLAAPWRPMTRCLGAQYGCGCMWNVASFSQRLVRSLDPAKQALAGYIPGATLASPKMKGEEFANLVSDAEDVVERRAAGLAGFSNGANSAGCQLETRLETL